MHIRAAFFEPKCVLCRVERSQSAAVTQSNDSKWNRLRAQNNRIAACLVCVVCLCVYFCCLCPHSVNFLNGSAVVCELVANKVATAVLFLILEFLN